MKEWIRLEKSWPIVLCSVNVTTFSLVFSDSLSFWYLPVYRCWTWMTRAPGSWTRPPPAHPSQSSTRSTRTFLLSGGQTTRISHQNAFLLVQTWALLFPLSSPSLNPSQSSTRSARLFLLSVGQTTCIYHQNALIPVQTWTLLFPFSPPSLNLSQSSTWSARIFLLLVGQTVRISHQNAVLQSTNLDTSVPSIPVFFRSIS